MNKRRATRTVPMSEADRLAHVHPSRLRETKLRQIEYVEARIRKLEACAKTDDVRTPPIPSPVETKTVSDNELSVTSLEDVVADTEVAA